MQCLLHLLPLALPQARPADCLQWVPTSDSQEGWLAAAQRKRERTSTVLLASSEPYGEACAQPLLSTYHPHCCASSKQILPHGDAAGCAC
jgi:hypothetical protein